jgi:hypothetical protein
LFNIPTLDEQVFQQLPYACHPFNIKIQHFNELKSQKDEHNNFFKHRYRTIGNQKEDIDFQKEVTRMLQNK